MTVKAVGLVLGILALIPQGAAAEDGDFPQEGQSYGGKVRSGPGVDYALVTTLNEKDTITILAGTGVMMNGYEWFRIDYGDNREGYQWGGVMCSRFLMSSIYNTCSPHQALLGIDR